MKPHSSLLPVFPLYPTNIKHLWCTDVVHPGTTWGTRRAKPLRSSWETDEQQINARSQIVVSARQKGKADDERWGLH